MNKTIKVKDSWKKNAQFTKENFDTLYQQSIKDPEVFWATQAERLLWKKKWTKVKNTSFTGDVHIEWFCNGKLNVSENCIDRHLKTQPNQPAFIWEPDSPKKSHQVITYQKLHDEVCKFANGLKSLGVKKGDRVTLYLPMIPEAVYSMLACARIGAIHSVVFAGFSPESLSNRILDCDSRFIITADEGLRGGKTIPLKANVDMALKTCPNVQSVVVVKHTKSSLIPTTEKDVDYNNLTSKQASLCQPEVMDSEDPLFILYTSGSTGKPKGVLHTTGGYLTYASLTHETVFNYKPNEIYWCTADIGWVTGHSYVVYGPLSNGATSILFEGVPHYPDYSRHWEIVDKHKVNIYYTAPTAIRALMQQGERPVKKHSRESLRILGSVGEPINPEAWEWYYKTVGDERCPIVDTWWQTETGGILITPIPGINDLKPGSATKPFFGIEPAILDSATGKELFGESQGILCLKGSWPGQMRTVYKNHSRFVETYFSQYKGLYFTGDGCKRDADGDYWITGRVDDVLNVSGHRMGTAEVESALIEHPAVCESAVVGFPHPIKGEGIYAYVTLTEGFSGSDQLKNELLETVKNSIGAIAKPDFIQWAPALPKTRSGKIMRRILRKIAHGEMDSIGDVSTLADPKVVDDLIANRKKT